MSRAHKTLSTWFKNRETQQNFATGKSQIPTAAERKAELEKQQDKKLKVDEANKSKPAAMSHTVYDAHDREERQVRHLVHGTEGGVQSDKKSYRHAKTVGVKEDMDITKTFFSLIEGWETEKKKKQLRDALDRHTEKALAANRAGDHDAVKVHQTYMNKIKGQMERLARNESIEDIWDESEFQLDEISKTTLGSYISKSHDQLLKHTGTVNMKYGRGDKDATAYALDKDALRKTANRTQGMKTAISKLTKEEVEELDEISKATLGSYVKKASDDITKRDVRINTALEKDIRANTTKAELKQDKRKLGMHKAIDRLTKEEVELDEAWNVGNRNPQRGIKVGHKVRSYDFPGMHDSHYIEGHVVGETPHSYHIKVSRVVRDNKEIPTPAHMHHVEAPKGKSIWTDAYAVHKLNNKLQTEQAVAPVEKNYYKGVRLHFAKGNRGGKSSSNKGGAADGGDGGGSGGGAGGGGDGA